MSRFTPERVALAREVIDRYPVARSALIPLLHIAQEQDGYVAEDAMEHIAELIGCTPAEVYGTASFYEMFKFHPVGKYVVGVCTNISCLLEGAEELLEHAETSLKVKTGGTTADGLFTLEDVECIAACTVAPCLQVNYRYVPNVTPESFDDLVGKLRRGELDGEIPPHGTLARIRQQVPEGRWAGSGNAPPPLAETAPGPALGTPRSGDRDQADHGEQIGQAVAPGSTSAGSPHPAAPETGTGRPAGDRPDPPASGADPTR